MHGAAPCICLGRCVGACDCWSFVLEGGNCVVDVRLGGVPLSEFVVDACDWERDGEVKSVVVVVVDGIGA